jgi:trans-aconitate 2-methyltransferase
LTSPWNPDQYGKYANERTQPFLDLLARVRPIPGGHAIDLGCGTGELTKLMHETVGAAETIGFDSSETMLARSAAHAGNGLRFVHGDIGALEDAEGFDLVFSNAALQWVLDHPVLFPRLMALVRPGGQFAVQMPANHDHASHVVAHEVAGREPFRSLLGGYIREVPVLDLDFYASLLFRQGFSEQSVDMHVYPHALPGPEDVIEWVKGSLLTDYERRLSPADYGAFLEAYRAELLPRMEDSRPYFYGFKRVLMWGTRT